MILKRWVVQADKRISILRNNISILRNNKF